MAAWVEVSRYFVCTESSPSGRWLAAKCRLCLWAQAANITRMKRHYREAHSPSCTTASTGSIPATSSATAASNATPSDSSSAIPPASTPSSVANTRLGQGSKRKRQPCVLEWTDSIFGPARQTASEQLLASLQVCTSLPYSVLARPEMEAFCRSLHSEFKLPSRDALQLQVKDLYLTTKERVLQVLTDCTLILGVDGWEDSQLFHVLGVTAQCLKFGSPAFLLYSERQTERHTTNHAQELYVRWNHIQLRVAAW